MKISLINFVFSAFSNEQNYLIQQQRNDSSLKRLWSLSSVMSISWFPYFLQNITQEIFLDRTQIFFQLICIYSCKLFIVIKDPQIYFFFIILIRLQCCLSQSIKQEFILYDCKIIKGLQKLNIKIVIQNITSNMRHNVEEQLQISEFIKDPASLKLLILAGTNIRANQILTVNKCISLIKLDLSSNQLKEVPLHFSNFHQMRILYLHDNQLTVCTIVNTNLQYISLFDNPLLDYRANLIQANTKLMAIDYHVITKTERLFKTAPLPLSLLKWPIVEISQSLQHEEDYLNLLKAQLFVVNEVYKRATFTTLLNGYMLALSQNIKYNSLKHALVNQSFFKLQQIKKMAIKWKEYVERRQKLKRILSGTSKNLLLNQLQRIRLKRSPRVNEILLKFLKYIRQKMKARKVLQRNLRLYRQNIPVYRQIERKLLEEPLKLYFRQSQIYSLQKIFLFAKKMFFNKKLYDLCDNFDKIVCKTKKSYYIFRSQAKDDQSFLMHMVKNSMRLVLGQKGVDRRGVNYNKKGHRQIQIKQVNRLRIQLDWQKIKSIDQRIQRLYKRYDSLLEYQFKNETVYQAILKLLKYFNCGNGGIILQNQAAYFQTQVIFQDANQKNKKEKLNIGFYSSIKRVLSTNIIQKWWRRMLSKVHSQKNIITQLKINRSHRLIGRWLRDMVFRHRLQLNKIHSFQRSTAKQLELLVQLDIYMNLPAPQDLLKYKLDVSIEKDYLYKLIHNKTQIEIIQIQNRSWVKVKFGSQTDAYQAQKQLSMLTYRYYYNGFYLKMFTSRQISNSQQLLIYEKKAQKLYGIKTSVKNATPNRSHIASKKIYVDNPQSFFIWPNAEENVMNIFKPEEVHKLPISVFIYNKNRRPLKVNCDLLWIGAPSIYHYRKKMKMQMRGKTPQRQKVLLEPGAEHYLPHIRHKFNRSRQNSVKQHKSLIQANRQKGYSAHVQIRLLSETLNITKRQ